MPQPDFEKYAKEYSMEGKISENWKKIFKITFLDKIKNYKDIKILDYGCGDGKYFDFFKTYFDKDNIYGVEISRKRIQRAKSKGWSKIFLIKTKQKLPFNNEIFDFINFDQVIEHIPCNEIIFYFNEFYRVLKKEGIILIMTPNYPIKRVYDFIYGIITKKVLKFKDDPTHICHYNVKKLNDLTKKYFNTAIIIPTGGIFYRISHLNFLSHKIIAICKKK